MYKNTLNRARLRKTKARQGHLVCSPRNSRDGSHCGWVSSFSSCSSHSTRTAALCARLLFPSRIVDRDTSGRNRCPLPSGKDLAPLSALPARARQISHILDPPRPKKYPNCSISQIGPLLLPRLRAL